jgi:SAM-dependent methyltransferase
MFQEEALHISQLLSTVDLKAGQVLLDIGSSTAEYRCLDQPYIDYYLFAPLRNKGLKIVHVDQKAGIGVDIVCDLVNMRNQVSIQGDIVLCSNLLEHVSDRDIILDELKGLTKTGGVIILTVPHVFKYHPDPIDTMYRPSPEELRKLFPEKDYATLSAESIRVHHGATNIRVHSVLDLLKTALMKVAKKLRVAGLIEHFRTKNRVSIIAVKKLS